LWFENIFLKMVEFGWPSTNHKQPVLQKHFNELSAIFRYFAAKSVQILFIFYRVWLKYLVFQED